MSLRRRLADVSLILVLGVALSPRLLEAQSCSIPSNFTNISMGDTVNLTLQGFTAADVQTAANYWACPAYDQELPTFHVGGSGGVPVSVTKITGNSTTQGGGCGLTTRHFVNGQLVSAEIEIWTNQVDGSSCEPLTDVLAHEFGHVLGLENAPAGSSCMGHIMGGRVLPGGTRTVYGEDCAVADQRWETTYETQPPDDPYCNAYCWTSCIGSYCPPGNPWCPILVDLENDGFHLTGLDDPVWFDIDADGDTDLISWTDRSEGILVLDRNGNGWIDDGGELFGNATRLANGSRAENGYVALAELDSWVSGGNGDGVLDANDSAFSSLRMWTDLNHDGISQSEEMQTLPEAGITQMDLDYKRSHRTDRYGNEFRFLGRAWKKNRHGVVHPVLTWDVFFLVAH